MEDREWDIAVIYQKGRKLVWFDKTGYLCSAEQEEGVPLAGIDLVVFRTLLDNPNRDVTIVDFNEALKKYWNEKNGRKQSSSDSFDDQLSVRGPQRLEPSYWSTNVSNIRRTLKTLGLTDNKEDNEGQFIEGEVKRLIPDARRIYPTPYKLCPVGFELLTRDELESKLAELKGKRYQSAIEDARTIPLFGTAPESMSADGADDVCAAVAGPGEYTAPSRDADDRVAKCDEDDSNQYGTGELAKTIAIADGGSIYEALLDAPSGSTVLLAADATVDQIGVEGKSIVIDLGGNTLVFEEYEEEGYALPGLIVLGSGELSIRNGIIYSKNSAGLIHVSDGSISLEDDLLIFGASPLVQASSHGMADQGASVSVHGAGIFSSVGFVEYHLSPIEVYEEKHGLYVSDAIVDDFNKRLSSRSPSWEGSWRKFMDSAVSIGENSTFQMDSGMIQGRHHSLFLRGGGRADITGGLICGPGEPRDAFIDEMDDVSVGVRELIEDMFSYAAIYARDFLTYVRIAGFCCVSEKYGYSPGVIVEEGAHLAVEGGEVYAADSAILIGGGSTASVSEGRILGKPAIHVLGEGALSVTRGVVLTAPDHTGRKQPILKDPFAEVSLSGGSFSSRDVAEWCEEGYSLSKGPNGEGLFEVRSNG